MDANSSTNNSTNMSGQNQPLNKDLSGVQPTQKFENNLAGTSNQPLGVETFNSTQNQSKTNLTSESIQSQSATSVQPLILQSPPPPPPPPPPPSFPMENPELKPPGKGIGIKKILIILAIILAVVSFALLVVKILLPRLKNIKLPGKQVTLTYWGLWEPNSVMEGIINEFEVQNPSISVEYVQQNHREYRERLQSAIARGEGPDIFRFHNTWVPMFRDDLDKIPTDAYSSQEFQDIFYPAAVNDLKVGSSFVGIPLQIDGLALIYNKKIFNDAGKVPPSTWEELRKTAFDLTIRDQNGRLQTSGVALGTTGNIDFWSDILALMMLQNGADLSSPDEKLAADALLFYTLFSRSDKVWDSTMPNSSEAFSSGKVAMIFAPSWKILDIKAINPEIDIGIVSIPKLPNSNINWASYWVEGVSARSENKTESWKFLKYLSQKDSLEDLYKAAVTERYFGEPYGRKDMADLLRNDPFLGAYINQAMTAKSWYLCSFTHDNGINDRMIKYFEDAVNAVNNKEDAQEALLRTSQGVSQILTQYKVK
jgi:multiple sugar transport system substrate-binding protein